MNQHALRYLIAWGIPFAVVVAALGYETDWGQRVGAAEPPPAKVAPSPVSVALLPEYSIGGGVDARRETVERTLFNPTRRAAPPATQTAAAGAVQHGQYTLTGTTVTGNAATAFLRDVKGGKSHTVRQGDALNGITVAEVKPDYVKLKQGDDVEELRLKIAAGPKSTIQPAVPAPAAPVSPTANAPAPVTGVAELLAQRRRAAQEAAAGGSGSGNAAELAKLQSGGVLHPLPVPVVPPAPPPPTADVQKAANGNPDWARVYQGIGQVRR